LRGREDLSTRHCPNARDGFMVAGIGGAEKVLGLVAELLDVRADGGDRA
jgi:hypothetical protein